MLFLAMRPIPQVTYDMALRLAANSGVLGVILDEAIEGNEVEHCYVAYASLRLMVDINAGLREKIQHMRGAMEQMEKVTTQMAERLESLNRDPGQDRSDRVHRRKEAIDPEFGTEQSLFEPETRIPLGGVAWIGPGDVYDAHRAEINHELAQNIANWAKDLDNTEKERKTLGKAENAPDPRKDGQ